MITFKHILQEIGVNKPGKIIAREYTLGDIIIDNYTFANGKHYYYPGYYVRYIFDVNAYKDCTFFKYLKRLQRENDGVNLYGIPKFQVEIVDKLDEIGINSPIRLKAELYNSNPDRIQIDGLWTFWNGDDNHFDPIPGYWCWFFYEVGTGNENLGKFQKWKYFKLFTKLKEDDKGEGDIILYGIPKSQVEIIDKY